MIAGNIVISLAMLCVTDVPDNADMETYKIAYSDVLANVRIVLTDEKEAWLNGQSGKLSGERGFEVLYDQYIHVHENPADRFFMYTNGWAGLLSESALNIPLMALILLLVTPVLCGEYACQMDSLTLTAKHGNNNTKMKLLLVLCAVTFVCAADSLIRYGFFAIKYGLPNGEYPLQSLPIFGASAKTISLAGGFLLVCALRWMGAVYLSAVVLFVSVLTKKAAPAVFLSAAAVILPYMSLSASAWFSVPMPLPFLLGTGFLSGSEYVTDYLTGEVVPVFIEVSFNKLALLTGVSVLLCAGCVFVLLKKYRNTWGSAKKHGLPVLCVLLAFTLCGCGKTDSARTVSYSDEACYETAEMRCYFDYENNTIYKEDLETGEVTELLRSPRCPIRRFTLRCTELGIRYIA